MGAQCWARPEASIRARPLDHDLARDCAALERGVRSCDMCKRKRDDRRVDQRAALHEVCDERHARQSRPRVTTLWVNAAFVMPVARPLFPLLLPFCCNARTVEMGHGADMALSFRLRQRLGDLPGMLDEKSRDR